MPLYRAPVSATASIAVDNQLFVNPSNGNDTTGTRSRLDLPYATMQAALNAASAGDTVNVAAGTYDLGSAGTGTNRIVIPANVNVKGAGRGLTIIKSDLLGTSSPFTGFIVPGDNSIISDLSAIAYKVGGGTQHTCPLRKASGASESYTNVRWERCHLYGLADCVIATGGVSFGDHTFIDCLFESANDVMMWQSASSLVLIDCEIRHTTLLGFESLGCTGIYDGGAGGSVKVYGGRFTLGGSVLPTSQAFILEADSHVEVYDFVIDYRGLDGSMSATSFEITNSTPGSLIVSNVRRADGKALRCYPSASPVPAVNVSEYKEPKVRQIASNATWSPNADTDDDYIITAQAVAVTTISNPSGTPKHGQRLTIRVKDNGTARALTWSGTQWRASSDLPLPTTTTAGKTMYLGFAYDLTDTKWDLVAKLDNF